MTNELTDDQLSILRTLDQHPEGVKFLHPETSQIASDLVLRGLVRYITSTPRGNKYGITPAGRSKVTPEGFTSLQTTFDFHLANHGTVFMLTPLTDAAREWRDENLGDDLLTLGAGIAIQPRMVEHIVEGIIGDGLSVDTTYRSPHV